MPRARQPIEGINRDTYAEALRAHGHRNVLTIDGEDDLAAAGRAAICKPGGAMVCLGAGSITALDAWPAAAMKLEGRRDDDPALRHASAGARHLSRATRR